MDKIRKFPNQDERVETGAIQFGKDWPGLFIRGDNAAWYRLNLMSILEKAKNGEIKLDILTELSALNGIISDLGEPL